MLRHTLHVQASGELGTNLSWHASVRGFYDAVFDVDDFYPQRVEDDRRLEGDLHETYLDIASGDWEPREAVIHFSGTYSVIRASSRKARAINLPTIQVAVK